MLQRFTIQLFVRTTANLIICHVAGCCHVANLFT